MDNKKHDMIDGITEAMREIFETTENDMIARANLALIKGAPINEVLSINSRWKNC